MKTSAHTQHPNQPKPRNRPDPLPPFLKPMASSSSARSPRSQPSANTSRPSFSPPALDRSLSHASSPARPLRPHPTHVGPVSSAPGLPRPRDTQPADDPGPAASIAFSPATSAPRNGRASSAVIPAAYQPGTLAQDARDSFKWPRSPCSPLIHPRRPQKPSSSRRYPGTRSRATRRHR